MRLRPVVLLLVTCVLFASVSCTNPLVRQYEYDEQTYLDVDGSATVVLSASVASLVALRGMTLDPSAEARLDSDDVRAAFEAAGCVVQRASRPWRRDGRRFVQVRLELADVTKASSCGPLAWSTYTFERTETTMTYKQVVGASSGAVPQGVNWSGSELVAFKLHLPSKVTFHNTGEVERGNILTWEQRLTERQAGAPIEMRVVTDAESILYQTVFLFVGAFAAAVVVLITIIWIVIRRGRARLKEFRR